MKVRYEIVLISGKMGSGKTTLSKELAKRADKHWRVMPLIFAGSIYQLHDMVLNQVREWGIPVPSEKDRKLLQFLGADWGRSLLGDDVWVNIVRNEIRRVLKDLEAQSNTLPVLFIISDCRYRNEFDAFPDALRVRLSCKEEVRKQRAESWRETQTHSSEMDLDSYAAQEKFDMYIDTRTVGVQGMTELVLAQLDKGTWKEKRRK